MAAVPTPADDLLALDATALLAQCEVDTFRASGPGGQKRNKTDSGVRIRHLPTRLAATATESRSQHDNRRAALRRLRERIALEVRSPIDLGAYEPPKPLVDLIAGGRIGPARRRSDEYLPSVQAALDLFVTHECALGQTAVRLGVTTAALGRFLLGDPALARKVNELRGAAGLRPLSPR